MRLLPRDFEPALRSIAPGLTAILTFAAGVMLLISGETPSEHDRVVWLLQYFPPWVLNLSHFLSSLLGLALVLVAFGLRERLDAAWVASVIVTALAAVLALFKGVNWEETVVLAALCGAARLRARRLPRHAALTQMEIAPGWMLSALAMGAGACSGLVVVQERRLRRPALVAGDGRRRRRPRDARRRRRGRAAAGLRGLADVRHARDPAGGRRARSRISTVCAPSWPAPRTPRRTPTWRCSATSASCSPKAARAS